MPTLPHCSLPFPPFLRHNPSLSLSLAAVSFEVFEFNSHLGLGELRGLQDTPALHSSLQLLFLAHVLEAFVDYRVLARGTAGICRLVAAPFVSCLALEFCLKSLYSLLGCTYRGGSSEPIKGQSDSPVEQSSPRVNKCVAALATCRRASEGILSLLAHAPPASPAPELSARAHNLTPIKLVVVGANVDLHAQL
jgi:hypothetical protein